jgi:nitrogen fixation NifU-like protein
MIDHPGYSEILLDHYRHPRNVGDLAEPDVVVTVGNADHGDVMRLSLRIDAGCVREARFKVFGCTAAIAAGSMTTELIRGRRLEEVGMITNAQVAQALGGLPESKIHCSILAEQALKQAIVLYRSRFSDCDTEHGTTRETTAPGVSG